jgi:anti-anti-sigma factor
MRLKFDSTAGDVVKVSVEGRVDQAQFQSDQEPFEKELGAEVYQRRLLVDMHSVEFLDSSGVGWLLKCHRRFRDHGGALVLYALSPMVGNVLRILRMDQVLITAGTENEARQRLQTGSPDS